MKNNVVIVGAGGHASVLFDLATVSKIKSILILNDEDGLIKATDSYNNRLKFKNEYEFIVGIGDNRIRRKLLKELKEEGYNLSTLIHPSAVIASNAVIKQGTCVIAGAVINNDVVIGEGCIINTRASVDHHSVIGSYTHIAPGVTIAGQCKIGERCLIGVGATIKNGITIVDDVIIGAGGVVVEDILEPGTYIGVPVKKIK